MTSKERVRKTFSHQEPDRVPVFEIGFNSPAASEILGREAWVGIGGHIRAEIWNQMRTVGRHQEFVLRQVQDYIDLYRKLELDILPTSVYPSDPPIPVRIDEKTWKYEDEKTGTWSVYMYEPLSDMYCEVDSDVATEGIPAFERMVKRMEETAWSKEDYDFTQIDYAVKEIGREMCILGGADIGFPGSSWLITFLVAMRERPDLVDRFLDACLERTLFVAEEQLKRGATLMWGGVDICYSDGPLFSPEMFRRFFVPRLKQITDLCHRYHVPYFKHTDGNIRLIEEALLYECGIDGLHPLEPEAGMDLRYYKEKCGDTITLLGNVSCAQVLVYGTTEEIEEETRKAIEVGAPGGGYVLSSSNTIHSQVPAEKYLVMLEAARNYGRYPIVRRPLYETA
jgi:uroporphyrinogen-III decarboxylase